ncbi:restriction endonuclease subunit S [Providencia alcalifaciens]|nr:restriction endonuclease subunit S [Providencia alcalifaciens]MTC55104.1 restriction endonuclease subunit S [Providencia alcalifaciens]
MERLALMPKYDDYVDSGVEWLGRVPASWELTRLGTRFNERRSKVSDIDYPALSVTKKGVLPQLDNAAKTKDGDNRKLVKEGDFVINSRSDRKGSSGVSDRDGSVSLINIVLKPKGIHPKFSEHLLKSHAFIEEYYRVGRGIVADLWTTRYDEMRTITISVPSLEEQTRIANFLDKKTALIDDAIAIKEQQISLLKERKQIIIQQAVTQGLDPNVPMKDSGVDWIGKIPAHWEVKRLKYVTKILKRIIGYEGPDVLSITQKGIKVKDIESGEGQLAMDYSKYQIVRVGDFAMNHMDLLTGYVDISQFEGIVSPDYRVFINTYNGLRDDFLLSIFQLGYQQKIFYRYGQGVSLLGRWRFPADNFNNFFIPVPPIEEQAEIVQSVQREWLKLDNAIELLISQIEKLKEYKTTLINSAVTGKIKITPEMVEQ